MSPSFQGALPRRQARLPVEVLAPVRPPPLDCSRGPVKGVLRSAVSRILLGVLCLGLPRSERTREFGRQESALTRSRWQAVPQVYMPGPGTDVGQVKLATDRG